MPFDWEKFIAFAEELSLNRSDEASFRSAISRAYYGAFGKIKIYVSAKHKIEQSPGDGIHQKIIATLKGSGDSQEYSLGNSLSQLRDFRNDADYKSFAIIDKPLVDKCIERSKDLIVLLRKLNQS